MTLSIFLSNMWSLCWKNIWILVVLRHSCSSVRPIVVDQNIIIIITMTCLNILLFSTEFILYTGVAHFKLYHKLQLMQLPNITYLAAILGCTMLQSQLLLRLLAFWKFVLILLMFITNWATNACDCLLMQHLLCTVVSVFALKTFVSSDQSIMGKY